MDYKIKRFTDLSAWQEAHKLVLAVYKTTEFFPSKETYSLIDQMRRSAISITSNIAEGFSRQGIREKLQFYFTAKGSLSELQSQMLIARDVGYLEESKFTEIESQAETSGKLLTGLVKSLKAKS